MHHWKVSFLKLSSVNSVNSIKPYSCIARPPRAGSCKMVTLSACPHWSWPYFPRTLIGAFSDRLPHDRRPVRKSSLLQTSVLEHIVSHRPPRSTMYTVALPKPLVVAFVALSSSLWFTSLLLVSGMIYGEVGEGKVSVFDFVSGLTSVN